MVAVKERVIWIKICEKLEDGVAINPSVDWGKVGLVGKAMRVGGDIETGFKNDYKFTRTALTG